MSLKWPKRPINDPNDSSNEQNQPTAVRQAFVGQIVFSGSQSKLFSAKMRRKGCFWMNGFWGVYSWWPAYANTNICIYSGLTRARRLFRHFPFLSQFMLIHLFVPICVNSSVGISLDARRLRSKHGQLDEDGINSIFLFLNRDHQLDSTVTS